MARIVGRTGDIGSPSRWPEIWRRRRRAPHRGADWRQRAGPHAADAGHGGGGRTLRSPDRPRAWLALCDQVRALGSELAAPGQPVRRRATSCLARAVDGGSRCWPPARGRRCRAAARDHGQARGQAPRARSSCWPRWTAAKAAGGRRHGPTAWPSQGRRAGQSPSSPSRWAAGRWQARPGDGRRQRSVPLPAALEEVRGWWPSAPERVPRRLAGGVARRVQGGIAPACLQRRGLPPRISAAPRCQALQAGPAVIGGVRRASRHCRRPAGLDNGPNIRTVAPAALGRLPPGAAGIAAVARRMLRAGPAAALCCCVVPTHGRPALPWRPSSGRGDLRTMPGTCASGNRPQWLSRTSCASRSRTAG